MNRWLFLLRRLGRKLWVRAGLYAAFGVGVALASVTARPWVPKALADRFGGESVEQVLTILASSMLAVATFSLGAMVTAYTSVSQQATPRIAELVTEDEATQKSLATFVGAFLFAVVCVTAIHAQYYDTRGRAVIFGVTLVVVGLVAFRLLAWINRLSSLARVPHMIELVEARTLRAVCGRLDPPRMGGGAGVLKSGVMIPSQVTGYVQNVDPQVLEKAAEDLQARVQVIAMPGDFVLRGQPLARAEAEACEEDVERAIRNAYVVAPNRSFDQDPRYGLAILGEIAGKALSPGVNDPGTAVQVAAAGVRLLDQWQAAVEAGPVEPSRPRLLVPDLEGADLLHQVFGPVIRYGAGDVAVMQPVLDMLTALEKSGGAAAKPARALARVARERALGALDVEADRRRISAV